MIIIRTKAETDSFIETRPSTMFEPLLVKNFFLFMEISKRRISLRRKWEKRVLDSMRVRIEYQMCAWLSIKNRITPSCLVRYKFLSWFKGIVLLVNMIVLVYRSRFHCVDKDEEARRAREKRKNTSVKEYKKALRMNTTTMKRWIKSRYCSSDAQKKNESRWKVNEWSRNASRRLKWQSDHQRKRFQGLFMDQMFDHEMKDWVTGNTLKFRVREGKQKDQWRTFGNGRRKQHILTFAARKSSTIIFLR